MKIRLLSSLFLSTVMCFSLSALQSTPSAAADQSSSSTQSSSDNSANQPSSNQTSPNQTTSQTSGSQTSSSTTDQSSTSTSTQDSTTQNSTNQSSTNQSPDNQNANDQNRPDQTNNQIPTYRITVVERTTEAVDYRDRGGTTQVDIKGTTLMPKVTGNCGPRAPSARNISPTFCGRSRRKAAPPTWARWSRMTTATRACR